MTETLSRPTTRIEALNLETDLYPLADLYAEVFAGPPWNEYTVCNSCYTYNGLETRPAEVCPCGGHLDLAYPQEETAENIVKEATNLNAISYVIKEGDDIIGFTWGYTCTRPEDFAQKYRRQEMQLGVTQLIKDNGITGSFFYLSECGVRQDRRDNGLSNVLVSRVLNQAKMQELPVLLRTNCESPMAAVATKFGMQQIMGPEVEIDKAQRRILRTGITVNNYNDSEIEDRVLFMLK